jgi:phosphate/sulfate permease
MELILLLFFWGCGSIIAGLFGIGKSIGFWGTFFISLILSPIIGFIIAIVSSPVRQVVRSNQVNVKKYVDCFEQAQKFEHRGDTQNAIDNYKDTLFYLNQAPQTSETITLKYRTRVRKEATEKLKTLKAE